MHIKGCLAYMEGDMERKNNSPLIFEIGAKSMNLQLNNSSRQYARRARCAVTRQHLSDAGVKHRVPYVGS